MHTAISKGSGTLRVNVSPVVTVTGSKQRGGRTGVAWRLGFAAAVAALAVLASAPAARAANNLGLFFDLRFFNDQSGPSSTGYAAFPELHSQPAGQPSPTDVESPNSEFYATLDTAATVGSAGSIIYADFNAYKTELSSAGWTLTTGVGHASPTAYGFAVDASAITAFATTPAHVSSGFQGSSRPNTTDITWSGPSGFDSITLVVSNATDGSQDQYSLPGTATSFTPPSPLTNGNYVVLLQYVKDVTGQISSDTPTNGLHGPLSNWDGVVGAQEVVSDQVTFAVVPEPASLGGCCMAGLGWLLAAGRRARRA